MTVDPAGSHLVDAVILDLGGVICRYDFERAYRVFRNATGLDTPELRKRLQAAALAHRFERGEIDPATFVRAFNTATGASFSLDDFTEVWNDIFLGYTEGVQSLVPKIAPRTRLACLSNTNALHETYWRTAYADVLAFFERIFTSHRIGARKPEPGAYRAVLDYLGLPPDRVAFFDDVAVFVEGARGVGIRAYRVTSTAGMARDLEALLGSLDA